MPTDVIDTTAESVDEPMQRMSGADLAVIVISACGRTPQGAMCARAIAPPELLQADGPTIREAILSSMPPHWTKSMPMLEPRLNELDENDLRILLVMVSAFWCMGRIEGVQEERAANGEERD